MANSRPGSRTFKVKWVSYCARKEKMVKANEVMSKVHRTSLTAFSLGKFGTF